MQVANQWHTVWLQLGLHNGFQYWPNWMKASCRLISTMPSPGCCQTPAECIFLPPFSHLISKWLWSKRGVPLWSPSAKCQSSPVKLNSECCLAICLCRREGRWHYNQYPHNFNQAFFGGDGGVVSRVSNICRFPITVLKSIQTRLSIPYMYTHGTFPVPGMEWALPPRRDASCLHDSREY